MRRLPTLALLAFACAIFFAAVAAAKTIPGFRSPSGNIECLFIPSAPTGSGGRTPAAILCTIAHADYAKTLQARCIGPSGAGVDWHGFLLPAARKGAVSCSGGALYNPATQHPSYVTLAYGKTWRHKMFSCTSASNGVNCSNPSGHGMFISRQTWRTW
jgi:uncharacterized protein DUF6636